MKGSGVEVEGLFLDDRLAGVRVEAGLHRAGQHLALLARLGDAGVVARRCCARPARHGAVALLHLAHHPLERDDRLLRVGDHRRQQVRDAVVDRQLQHLRVDHDEAAGIGPVAVQQRQDHGVDADRLARPGGAGDQQMRHARQVGDHRRAADVLAQDQRQLGRRIARRPSRPAARAGRPSRACALGSSMPMTLRARHHGDAHRDRAHRAGDVVGQADHAAGLGAGRRLQLVAGHHRAGPHLDDLAAHAEIRPARLPAGGRSVPARPRSAARRRRRPPARPRPAVPAAAGSEGAAGPFRSRLRWRLRGRAPAWLRVRRLRGDLRRPIGGLQLAAPAPACAARRRLARCAARCDPPGAALDRRSPALMASRTTPRPAERRGRRMPRPNSAHHGAACAVRPFGQPVAEREEGQHQGQRGRPPDATSTDRRGQTSAPARRSAVQQPARRKPPRPTDQRPGRGRRRRGQRDRREQHGDRRQGEPDARASAAAVWRRSGASPRPPGTAAAARRPGPGSASSRSAMT